MHSEYNTQEHTAILHMRDKDALIKYGNERASNYENRISCKDMNSLTNNIIIADIESKIDLAARNKEYFMVTNNPGEDIIKHFKKKGFTITEDNNNITINWKNIK